MFKRRRRFRQTSRVPCVGGSDEARQLSRSFAAKAMVDKYLVPEDVIDAKLDSAIDYIGNLPLTEGKAAVLRAIYQLYENPSHPHFVDFKDWGLSTDQPDLWALAKRGSCGG